MRKNFKKIDAQLGWENLSRHFCSIFTITSLSYGSEKIIYSTSHTKRGHDQKIVLWEKRVSSFERVFFLFSVSFQFEGTETTFSGSIWLWHTPAVFSRIICTHRRRRYNDFKKVKKTHNFGNFLIGSEISLFLFWRE